MTRSRLFFLLCWMGSSLLHAEPVAPPNQVLLTLEGMVCNGCQKTVQGALEHLAFVERVTASFAVGGACLTLSGPGDTEAIRAAIAATKYTISALETVSSCPEALLPGARVDPWDGAEGLDARFISHGEEVDLEAQLVSDKFTIIDFGAPWCGPCHTAAGKLKAYLAAHEDVAVRVVTLDAPGPTESYALPVVEQHLKWAPGIPFFHLYAPSGKRIYKGQDVDKIMALIDKKRGK